MAFRFLVCAAIFVGVTGIRSDENLDQFLENDHLEIETKSEKKADTNSSIWPFDSDPEPRGLPLSQDSCTNRDIDNMVIGSVAVMCETITKVPQEAYHCGLQAWSLDGKFSRRYDLGPRDFQLSINPADLLRISIHCSEADPTKNKLHGYPEVPQFEWKTTPIRKSTRELKFRHLEFTIKDFRLSPTLYDLSGGNCQHFSFLLYEIMTSQPCHSLKTPNQDTWAELVRGFGSGAMEALKSTLKALSDQFQRESGYSPPRAEVCSGVEPWARIAKEM